MSVQPLFSNPRYTLQELLGSGGMGEVYSAYDRLRARKVALKRVTAATHDLRFTSASGTQDVRLALALEFRMLAGLRHRHIVSVLDYGFSSDQQPYFTMQLIEDGRTITDYAQTLDQKHKIRVLIEMLQALSYLHRRGIIHRDLKPANVLVTTDGRVKVMDFGLALHQSEILLERSVVGTVLYMAPELFRDVTVTIQSDLYSFGVMAYEIFVGRHPFAGVAHEDLFEALLHRRAYTRDLDPEIAAILDRLLAKSPSERYSHADEVIAALAQATGVALPSEDAELREGYLQSARFVGREAELQRLLVPLERLLAPQGGTGSAWLIAGESGVGKSRLIEELRIRALIAGAMVLQGQAVADGQLAFQIWRDPLRLLMLGSHLSPLEASVLKEILPDANRLLGYEIADAPPIEGQIRQRLMQTILGLFKRQAQPMLLILEDLHWADELDLLAQLNPLTAQLPLMIVASYRSEESPALAEALPQMQVITLSRLDDAAIVALSQAILGEIGEQSALLDLLRRETEGNAFFMVEVVRALAEEAGSLGLVGYATLPDNVFAGGIQEIVRRRLGRVPDWARELLKLAAIGGRQLDRRVMELLAVRVDYERWLNVCANAAVLEVVNDRWRFTHDRLRDGVIDGIQPEEAPILYREVAIAVELIYTEVPDHAAMIAKYWRAAGDTQKELHYTTKAARRAVDLSLYNDAQRLLHRILQLDALPALHMEALILLGEALEALGDYTDACDYAQQALEIARKIGSVDGMAQALKVIGNVRWREGAYDVAEQYLLESLQYRKLPITVIILGDVAWSRGDLGTARIYFERARRLTANTPQYYVYGEALQSLATVLWRLGDIDGAKQLLHDSIAIKQQIGNQRGVAASINSLGIIAERQGDLSGSAQYFELSLGLYEQLAIPWGISNVACNLAFVYLASHDLARAEATLYKGLSISTKLNSLPVTLELVAGFAQLAYQRDQVLQAAEWAGLVEAHPATNEFTHTIRLKPLKVAFEAHPTIPWQLAFDRGKQRPLTDILAMLLAET